MLYSGPALGRLDRFDAVGPHAYGGPALMGDSHSSEKNVIRFGLV